MIPPPGAPLTDDVERARWQLTKDAAALIERGVSPDTVMLDTRDGITLGRALARERNRP